MKVFKFLMIIANLFVISLTVGASISNSISKVESNIYAAKSASYPVNKYTYTYAPDSRPIDMPHFTADIYFSQSYFEHSSYQYDQHLATTSFCLAISTYPDYGDKTPEWYYGVKIPFGLDNGGKVPVVDKCRSDRYILATGKPAHLLSHLVYHVAPYLVSALDFHQVHRASGLK